MIQKQAVPIPFSKGLNQKVDPWQLEIGAFESLVNSIFTKDGLLQKRNGFGPLPSLPDASNSYVTTLNDNLTAVGTSITAYDEANKAWIPRGNIQPVEVSTLPLIRNSINQTQADTAIAPNGLVCTVYTETNAGTTAYKYAVADSVTGQNIVAPTAIPVSSGGITGSPRVFVLGAYFILVFTNTISGTPHLQYLALPYNNPTNGFVSTNADIASAYGPASTVSWDGVVVGNSLIIAYNGVSSPQSVEAIYLTSSLSLSNVISFASRKATVMSLAADLTDETRPFIYISFYDSSSSTGYCAVVNQFLTILTAPVEIISSGTILNITSAAQNGAVSVYYEVANNYSYDSSVPTHFVRKLMMNQAGTITGASHVSLRSVGLASKAFIINGTEYYLAAYQSASQPTYFLVNGTLSSSGAPLIVAKLAYSNGGGYLILGLPSVTLTGTEAQFAYLFKDLITSVNKDTNVSSTTQVAGIYSQTGINLGSINITTKSAIDTAEIGGDLNLSGGFLGMYDGYLPVEQNFFVWPDNIEVTGSTSSGSMAADTYFYQVTYEWSDNQGNIFKSAPSIPVTVTTTGTTSSVTVNAPTLRLTMKTANPVKIVVYRWSVTDPVYYQATSLTSATLNDTTIDSVTFVDTNLSVLGGSILYTTGGVAEDVNAPTTNIMTLFDTRLWLVDAEDPNLLWYSKQVIEATPVEMSDLFTIYVAPNTGTTGSTGPMTALAPMDDKLVIFKKNAIYYINGTGPDNTGANNQYSQPIFITSTVGCANQASIVLMPNGLMFQSDKGIWLLGRDLSTSYIGSPVEDFTSSLVTSANAIPETNQVRFTLESGETLVYDYFYDRWGIFEGVPSISSCIYHGLHTLINGSGEVFQEVPGSYLDGNNPVLVSFKTSWINVAGVQGYQRAFFFYLLGRYLTPHKLALQIAYDYNSSASQTSLIQPTNFSSPTPSPYGVPTPFGGPGDVENWRVFLAKQRCQSFQITMQEIYDPSFGAPAGAGLTLSGLNLVVGVKKGWRNIGNANTAGSTNA